MKITISRFPLAALLLVPLLLWGGNMRAAESYELEANVYVFKNSDFNSIQLPLEKETGRDGEAVIRSPAAIEFDREILTLAGAGFSWNNESTLSDRFTLLKIPKTITGPDKSVQLLSTAAVQYLEKSADGSLQVRNLAKDSADAPHCRITFKVAAGDGKSGDLLVSCDLDLAVVSAREAVPGVTLSVGRPVLARFQRAAEVVVHAGEWTALLLRSPNGSDHSLLLLLKATRSLASVDTSKSDSIRTSWEFARFATFYYRDPKPERITQAIELLGSVDFLDDGSNAAYAFRSNAYTCVGFFAEVFRANPDRVEQWRMEIDRAGGATKYWLRKALDLQRPGSPLSIGVDRLLNLSPIEENYVWWGAFIASGKPAYLRKLIDHAELIGGPEQFFVCGAEAMVLLAVNSPHHPLVRETLVARRQGASPRLGKLIDDLLTKDADTVSREIREMDHSPLWTWRPPRSKTEPFVFRSK